MALHEEVAAILQAAVGGFRYGVKIRAPHALVMVCLFRRSLSAKQKLQTIMNLTFEHAGHLAQFAALYKTLLSAFKFISVHLSNHWIGCNEPIERYIGRILMSMLVDGRVLPQTSYVDDTVHVAPAGYPQSALQSFLAGGIGGYLVWGRYSSINSQIVMYLVSRVLLGLYKRLAELRLAQAGIAVTDDSISRAISASNTNSYPFVAALTWACVMALFEETPHVLQRSLRQSMDDIYRFSL